MDEARASFRRDRHAAVLIAHELCLNRAYFYHEVSRDFFETALNLRKSHPRVLVYHECDLLHSSLQDHDEGVLHVLDGLVLPQSLHLEELMVIIALSLQSL